MNTSRIIHATEISKRFGDKTVVNNISMSVFQGEIFGLLGPSGAGKTTLVKMMAGIDIADCGEITVLDMTMPTFKVINKIGFMSQSDALYGELNAFENLEFFASIYGLKKAQRKNRIRDVVDLVNLNDDIKKPINQFSGGMKRRLSLAISLLHEPDVLILDEPTVGIDPVLRQSIWNELRRLSQNGTTIVVTTHVMDEAEKCDRLGMLRDGNLLAKGTPEELKKQTGMQTIEGAFLQYGGARQ
ncbi:ABC transporter ATP-binding protein [Halalkalibacter kiskunsagensis]|uniref:ABC transporter ATP-binding protein n=1 Tax=Halalkalibacter kiskunsagensis TaxID=1548599 RepID=A0ABV6KBQ6_9BACI